MVSHVFSLQSESHVEGDAASSGGSHRMDSRAPLPPAASTASDSIPEPPAGDWRPPARAPRGRRPPGGQGPESPLERKSGSSQHPPYPYPSYHYFTDPYGRYPAYPHGPPPYGFPPPPPGPHYGGHLERGGKRRHSEREREREDLRRHDFHPWDHESEHRPKRRLNEERERPKILSKEDNWREAQTVPEAGEKSALRRTESASSETSGSDARHHVTFAGSSQSKTSSQEAEPDNLSPTIPAMRSQPKKIMLRKMGDSSKLDTSEKQEQGESGKSTDRPADVKSTQSGEAGEQGSQEDATVDSAKQRPTAWKVTERSSVGSGKTLYEPEGKKSEAKFRKYQHDARTSGGGKRERGGPSPATTPSDTHPPANLPDAEKEGAEEKAPLKRTPSGDRGREGEGRKGRGGDRPKERDREDERVRWTEPQRGHSERQGDNSEPQRDHSVPRRDNSEPQRDHSVPRRDNSEPQRDHSGPRRDNSEPQRDHSGPRRDHSEPQRRDHPDMQRDYPQSPSDHHEQRRDHHEHPPRRQDSARFPRDYRDGERQERAPGRRGERGRLDRRHNRSRDIEHERETDQQKDEERQHLDSAVQPPSGAGQAGAQPSSQASEKAGRPDTSRPVQSDGEKKRREEASPGPQQRRPPRGAEQDRGGEPRDRHGRGQRLPSRGEGSKPRELPGRIAIPSDERKDSQSSATSARAAVPASVPQTVINKSVSAQATERLPISLPMPLPTGYPPSRPAGSRPPLLQDPPHPPRREPYDTAVPERRPRDSADGRRRQDKRRGGPEGARGEGNRDKGSRGSQRGRGDREREEGRENRGRQDSKQPPRQSVNDEKEVADEKGLGGERGRGSRRGRDRERRDHRDRARRAPEEGKLTTPQHEEQPAGQKGGKGRERRRRDSRRSALDLAGGEADSSQKPHKESRDSGRPLPADHKGAGGRKERDWGGRGRQPKSATSPEERKKDAKPDMEYQDLVENVETSSDWEERVDGDKRKSVAEREVGGGVAHAGGGAAQPRGRGRGQRRQEERREHTESAEQPRNEVRPGTGRGRGRNSEQGRGRPGKQGSQKTASGRPGEKSDSTQEAWSDLSPAAAPRGEKGSGKKGESKVAQSEKQSVAHKQQEFAKYDLNSHTIAIVDDIGSQQPAEEVESTSEFVEVTSKKAQKEKVKKEKEEQRRLAVEQKREEDQKKSRKSVNSKSPGQPSASQLELKPSTAWSSKDDDGPQTNIWSTSSAVPSSDWSSRLVPTPSAAPGAQLKDMPGPSWPSVGVGVIGEGLQARLVTATLASQMDPSAAASGDLSYSLFPMDPLTSLISPAPPYAGGMLSAAVDIRLSQEHLPPSSGDPSSSSTHAETEEDGRREAVQSRSKEGSKPAKPQPPAVKSEATEPNVRSELERPVAHGKSDEDRPVAHGRGRSTLPPRLQSSRANPGNGAGRGRGNPRGRKGERGGGRERELGEAAEGKSHQRESRTREKDKEKVSFLLYSTSATLL